MEPFSETLFGGGGPFPLLPHTPWEISNSFFCGKTLESPNFLGKGWATEALRHVAEHSCSVELARHLLEQGAEIDGRITGLHRTALHSAARNTSLEGARMVKFLLLNGADPELTQYVKRGSLQQEKKNTGRRRRKGYPSMVGENLGRACGRDKNSSG